MIARDKLAHFLAGIAVAAVGYPFGVYWALVAVAVAAVGKEFWDLQGNGTPEVWDAIATIFGGIALIAWYRVLP